MGNINEIRYNPYNLPTTLIKSGQTYQYRYDGSGKRIEKVQPNGSFECYRRGANGELLAIYDNFGGLKQFELEGIGEMRVEGGQWKVSVYDKDLFGNNRSTVAQNGTIERTYDADVWGYEYEAKQGSPSKTYDEKFLGNPRDRESGFDFTGSRLYSSKLGMFLGVEPMYDELHSISPFSYGNNNPAKFSDPTGKFPFVVMAIGGAVGGAFELGSQLVVNKGDFAKVDWADVGIATVAGSIGGGVLGKVGTVIARPLIQGAIDLSAGVAKESFNLSQQNGLEINNPINAQSAGNIAIDVIGGQAGLKVGDKVAGTFAKSISDAEATATKNATRLSPINGQAQKAAVNNAQTQIDKEYIGAYGSNTVSSSTSTGGKEAVKGVTNSTKKKEEEPK